MPSHRQIFSIFLLVATCSAITTEGQSKLRRVDAHKIDNEYIVVLNEGEGTENVTAVAADLTEGKGITARAKWSATIRGFSITMTEEQAEDLSLDSRVKYVEENARWFLSATHATYINPKTCDPTTTSCTPSVDDRLWHLDRADQNRPDPNDTYSYCTTGTGVTVYVVDTGVNKSHHEFGVGAVVAGTNKSGDNMPADDPCIGFAAVADGPSITHEQRNRFNQIFYSGHGTAVASAIAGKRVGIAKGATIVPIKVVRCDLHAARWREPQTAYAQNATMMRTSGSSITAIYQALNSGTTLLNDSSITWPTADNATVWDGGVQWKVVRRDDWQSWNDGTTTTEKLADGLEWILDGENGNPKTKAIVTMSLSRPANADEEEEPHLTVIEEQIEALLAAGITVIASANNQNGDACDTIPARMSGSGVITVGGSMLVNRPWTVDLTDVTQPFPAPPPVQANGGANVNALEPSHDATKGVAERRWICGAGDSGACSNTTFDETVDPGGNAFSGFTGGSNGGPCVTLFAPAKNVFLASINASDGYRDARLSGVTYNGWDDQSVVPGHASGTSWAAPIAAGFAARIMQGNSYTPAQVKQLLLDNSVAGDATNLNPKDYLGNTITGTPNKFLRLNDLNVTAAPQSTPASSGGGSTTLSVTASGTSTITYQWYKVKSGFDLVNYKHGAHSPASSDLITSATNSFYDAPAQSSSTGYWVRIKNGCGSHDTDIAVVVPRPSTPTNVVATASQDTVTVTWSASTGAERYEIYRKLPNVVWTHAGNAPVGTHTFLDAPPVTSGMAIYHVRAVAGLQYLPPTGLAASLDSNNDIANLDNDTYENLAVAPSFTSFKAVMLTELRVAANSFASAAEISLPYPVLQDTQASSLQGLTIQNEYLTDLMDKINSVRTHSQVGMPPATWGNTPNNDEIIVRSFVEELRAALN